MRSDSRLAGFPASSERLTALQRLALTTITRRAAAAEALLLKYGSLTWCLLSELQA